MLTMAMPPRIQPRSVCQGDELFTDAAGTHEHAHGDEEGNGHQAEGRDAPDHLLAQGVEAEPLHAQAEDGGQATA